MDQDSQEIILGCIRFIYDGSDIEDPEFFTRLGVTRAEVQQVLASWPHALNTADDLPATLAINNSMNEVCYGISISPDRWSKSFPFSRDEVEKAYAEWLAVRGNPGGVM